jgi:hypothetical protein
MLEAAQAAISSGLVVDLRLQEDGVRVEGRLPYEASWLLMDRFIGWAELEGAEGNPLVSAIEELKHNLALLESKLAGSATSSTLRGDPHGPEALEPDAYGAEDPLEGEVVAGGRIELPT